MQEAQTVQRLCARARPCQERVVLDALVGPWQLAFSNGWGYLQAKAGKPVWAKTLLQWKAAEAPGRGIFVSGPAGAHP
eukprot:14181257-Alexandrium_andersonii.AAC.1